MKARLKSKQHNVITVYGMKEGQFAVITSELDNGHIVFRPKDNADFFAVDLTHGTYWSTSRAENGYREVRILKAGELIEIVE